MAVMVIPGKPSTVVPQYQRDDTDGEEGTGINVRSNDTNDGHFAALYDHFSAWNSGGTVLLFTDSHSKMKDVQSDLARASVTSGNAADLCNP